MTVFTEDNILIQKLQSSRTVKKIKLDFFSGKKM